MSGRAVRGLLGSLLLAAGCATVPATAPPPRPRNAAHATYPWLRARVFTRCEYCHAGVGRATLDTWGGLRQLLVPYRPEQSRLYRMVASRRMPIGWSLTEEEISSIYWWIKQGAPRGGPARRP